MKLRPLSAKAPRSQREAFYKQHRIELIHAKSPRHVLLGDGTKLRILWDLSPLVDARSESGLAFREAKTHAHHFVLAFGLAAGGVLAGISVSFIGITAPFVPNNARLPVGVSGIALGGTAVIAFSIWAIVSAVLSNRASARGIGHYNQDLRTNLGLPPEK